MTLVLINGISTAGKSSIARELIDRGYEAYDIERNGISAWYNIESGERAAEFGKVPERTKEWMDQHEFRMSIDWLNDTAEKAKTNLIFLCGAAANDKEVYKRCDIVFWLKTDEHTIRNRLSIPREHTFGTKPHELERILKGNIRKQKEYENAGAVIIDARRDLGAVIDEIILSA